MKLKNQQERLFADQLETENLNPSTIRKYVFYLRLFQKECAEMDQQSIDKFIRKHKSNVTRSFLRKFKEIYDVDFKIKVDKSRKKRIIKKPMSYDHYKLIRNTLISYGKPLPIFLLDLSYYCGLRRSEVTGIKVDDFDWNLYKENRENCRLKITGKGNKERIVVVPKQVIEALIIYLKYAEIKDKRLYPRDVVYWHIDFKKAVRECMQNYEDFRDYTLHDLRRARATEWHRAGKDIITIRDRLGHEDISTT